MAKCYVILHTINKACCGSICTDVIAVYTEQGKAMEALGKVTDEIRSGRSKWFPDFVPTIEKGLSYGSVVQGITCQWLDDAQETMYSHFYVQESDFCE